MSKTLFIIQNNFGDIIDICDDLIHSLNKCNHLKLMISKYNDVNISKFYITIFNDYVLGTIIKNNEDLFILKTNQINNYNIDIISNIINNFNKTYNTNESSIFIKSDDDHLNINLPFSIINQSLDSNDGITLADNIEETSKIINEKINKLINLKEEKEKELLEEKKNLDLNAENISLSRLKSFELNKNLKIQQDKWNNFINKYKANKKVYYLLKSENKNSEDIPELFKYEWPIFKYLDDKNFISQDNYDNIDNELRIYHKLQPTDKFIISHTFDNLFINNDLSSSS